MNSRKRSRSKIPTQLVILIQLICSVFIGFIFALLSAFIAVRASHPSQGFADIARALLAIMIGYPLGVLLTILVSGKLLKRKGSIIFSISGMVASAIAFAVVAEPLHLNLHPLVLMGAFFAIPPLFICTGYWINDVKRMN